jgi:hypothetical protein
MMQKKIKSAQKLSDSRTKPMAGIIKEHALAFSNLWALNATKSIAFRLFIKEFRPFP